MQKDYHYAKYASQVTRNRCVRKNAWISIFQLLRPVVWSRRTLSLSHIITRNARRTKKTRFARKKHLKRLKRERDSPALTSVSREEEKIKREYY
tara:strand:+ start:1065 stop:1346 length:282 start_codon:yes stop_codon:yes gene_type:complete